MRENSYLVFSFAQGLMAREREVLCTPRSQMHLHDHHVYAHSPIILTNPECSQNTTFMPSGLGHGLYKKNDRLKSINMDNHYNKMMMMCLSICQ